jgi:hypothetical protein
MRYYILCLCASLLASSLFSQVVINEIFAENDNHVFDPLSESFPDYIELYNKGASEANISGYFLTDNPASPHKWALPDGTVIAPGQHLLIWADGTGKGLRANFKLSKSGEHVQLYSRQGLLLSQINYPALPANKTYGQQPDGSGNWITLSEPSPGKPNYPPAHIPGIEPPLPVSAPGIYKAAIKLELAAQQGASIYYTTNGKIPTTNSSLYAAPINISKNTVIRAIAVKDGTSSKVFSGTYIVSNRNFSLPVISIITDPDNFFSNSTGIYVEGTNGQPGRCADKPVNWNMDWRRPVNMEYFSTGGKQELSQAAEVRIMGGCSRTMGQKSLTVVAEEGRFSYPLFSDRDAKSYKSIVLRNSGNDWGGGESGNYSPNTMLRDAFMQRLLEKQLDLDLQAYQPVAVFINGEYWGLHNMREHLNNHYVANNHPKIDKDNIDLIKNYYDIKDGDDMAWKELIAFLESSNLQEADNYSWVEKRLDINSFINYQIAQIYYSNTDWPGNNVRFWRERSNGGKFRFIVFDTDFGFGIWNSSAYDNTIEHAANPQGPTWPNPPHSTLVLRKLLENNGFQSIFAQRFMVLMHTVFQASRVDSTLNSMSAAIKPEMAYHLPRWYQYGNSIEDWEYRIGNMKDWNRQRLSAMPGIIRSHFSLESPLSISIDSNGEKISYEVAGAHVPPNVQNIQLFPGLPVTIKAHLPAGLVFSHWENENGEVLSDNAAETFSFATAGISKLIAATKPRPAIEGLVINEVLASNQNFAGTDAGASPDYVELYNSSAQPIDISGLYITDNLSKLDKFALPHDSRSLTVQPGGFIRLWADGKPENGSLHLGWKISKNGGAIALSESSAAGAAILDKLEYPELPANHSYGRLPDGGQSASVQFPTPLLPNLPIANTARLQAMSAGRLKLVPDFHPNILGYTLDVPPGFENTIDIKADVYGLSGLDIQETNSAASITVTSENMQNTSVYSITYNYLNNVPNFLKTLDVSGGYVSGGFSTYNSRHLIIAETSEMPELNWELFEGAELLSYQQAAGLGGVTYISVNSPTSGIMEYEFSYSQDTASPLTGFTHNFSKAPGVLRASPSYTVKQAAGALHIGVNKTRDWDAIVIDFNGSLLSLGENPYLEIAVKASSACNLRIDLIDADGISSNGVSLTREIRSGDTRILTYDYNGGFLQTYPYRRDMDPSRIRELWLCFNPGESGLLADAEISYIKLGDHVIQKAAEPLAGIILSSGKLVPEFHPSISSYQVIGHSGIPAIYAYPGQDGAQVIISGFNALSGKAQIDYAAEGSLQHTYYLELSNTGLSADSRLADMWLTGGGELQPMFAPDIYSYFSVEPQVQLSSIAAITSSPAASHVLHKAKNHYQDSYVIVYAQDGSKSVYTISHQVPLIQPGLAELNAYFYPVPAAEYISFNGTETADIDILSMQGQQILSIADAKAGDKIYLPPHISGMFIARLATSSGIVSFVLARE